VLVPLLAAAVALAPASPRRRGRRTTVVLLVALSADLLAGGLSLARGPLEWKVGSVVVAHEGALAFMTALVATVIGVTVASYAGRNLEAYAAERDVQIATGLVVAGAVWLSLAVELPLVALGWWLGALGAQVALRSGGPLLRRARRTLVAADLLVAAVVAIAWSAPGSLDLAHLAPAGLAGVVVAVGLVAAALLRAGQFPGPVWLASTAATPTPVSALLHAGVVSAGGLVLLRCGVLLRQVPVASLLLLAASLVTAGRATLAMRVRPDRKGMLAISTGAQLGVALAMVGVGAPLAAASHLLGHGLYKANGFLDAGSSTERSAEVRRFDHPMAGRSRAAVGAAVAALPVLGFWWWLAPTGPGALSFTVAALAALALAMGLGAAAAPRPRSWPVAAVALLGVDAYLVVVRGLERSLSAGLRPATAAWWPLEVAVAVLLSWWVVLAVAPRRPQLSRRLWVLAAAASSLDPLPSRSRRARATSARQGLEGTAQVATPSPVEVPVAT